MRGDLSPLPTRQIVGDSSGRHAPINQRRRQGLGSRIRGPVSSSTATLTYVWRPWQLNVCIISMHARIAKKVENNEAVPRCN